ncbi:MAG TPA: hypothetical protein VG734_11920 [Lacunisphaera sp.]|nr:hypothetical protein [Lacunisphaera sp.]
MKVRFLYAWAALALGAALPAQAASTDEWVAKARAYLGSEKALNAADSLHFEGTVETIGQVPDPADPSKTIEGPVRLGIDIVFQKPMQQRQILRSDKVERVTTLDGYDAWERISDRTKPGSVPRTLLLDSNNIKRLRAATIENLSFYSTQGQFARDLRLLGDVTVDGTACVKLAFQHGNNIGFVRYIEKSTGRLVKTEIERGGEIREEGEILASGIRFPRKLHNKTADGRMTTISFDKVTVGEHFPADVFAVPSVPVPGK